jgi:uncharacterized damage-inducible protein DinB
MVLRARFCGLSRSQRDRIETARFCGLSRSLRDRIETPASLSAACKSVVMTASDEKSILHRYLRSGREALLWKLEGLSNYDIRRPLVPTGTNLIGLVKHVASTEAGYFGEVFHRPFDELPWLQDGSETNADMWATADESREYIVDLYQRVWAHSDATIDALRLDTIGSVPWWPGERSRVTLHQILVHMIAETNRHAGHADIVRELIDGTVGLRKGNDNMPGEDEAWWNAYRERLEETARVANDDQNTHHKWSE